MNDDAKIKLLNDTIMMIIEYNFQIIRKVNSEKFIRVKKRCKDCV